MQGGITLGFKRGTELWLASIVLTWCNIQAIDIVLTKGACLRDRPPTPLHVKINLEAFHHALLCLELKGLLRAQEIRRRKYGEEAAEEWPMGHTPDELLEKRTAEVDALIAAMEAPSPPSRNDSDDNEVSEERVQLGPAQ